MTESEMQNQSPWFAWGVEGTDLVRSIWKKVVMGEESEFFAV